MSPTFFVCVQHQKPNRYISKNEKATQVEMIKESFFMDANIQRHISKFRNSHWNIEITDMVFFWPTEHAFSLWKLWLKDFDSNILHILELLIVSLFCVNCGFELEVTGHILSMHIILKLVEIQFSFKMKQRTLVSFFFVTKKMKLNFSFNILLSFPDSANIHALCLIKHTAENGI